MQCMFNVDDQARLASASKVSGIADRAYQQAARVSARSVAKPRHRQGSENSNGGSDPIIVHPDVKRMLMQMRALTAAARTICYRPPWRSTFRCGARRKTRGEAGRAGALLTPIAKAFSTTSAMSDFPRRAVHGGMVFIEETGAAQHFATRASPRFTKAPTASSRSISSPQARGQWRWIGCGAARRICLRSSAKSKPPTIPHSAPPAPNCATRWAR